MTTKVMIALRILSSPLVRILLLGFTLVVMMSLNTDVMTSYAEDSLKATLHVVALAIAGFAVYIGYAHFIERRPVSELALPGLGRQLGLGMLIGAALYGACEVILMALGIYRIVGFNPVSYMIPAIAMAVSSSVYEELLFRGVLFGSIERWLGSWAALIVLKVAMPPKISWSLWITSDLSLVYVGKVNESI